MEALLYRRMAHSANRALLQLFTAEQVQFEVAAAHSPLSLLSFQSVSRVVRIGPPQRMTLVLTKIFNLLQLDLLHQLRVFLATAQIPVLSGGFAPQTQQN